jgi:fused signal recognition particle receptor
MAFSWFKKDKRQKGARDGAGGAGTQPTVDKPPDGDRVEPEAAAENRIAERATGPETDHESALAKPVSKESGGILGRLRQGLAKTRKLLTSDIDQLFDRRPVVDDDLLEELEEILITADIGAQTTVGLMAKISPKIAGVTEAQALKAVLKEEILSILELPKPADAAASKPQVVMVVGVNGVGKTTTIGKLAARCKARGQSVLVAAADTFRAAAIEQLSIWTERAGAEIVKHKDGADPAAVAYDAVTAACARGADVVFVDTAGRLHTKINLMEELKKIKRSIAKVLPQAPHETLLVLDATTGQYALSQAKLFHEAIGVTGLALTKLDGTAKGGIVISISGGLNIPLRYIGVGEKIEDLQDFDPRSFVAALF